MTAEQGITGSPSRAVVLSAGEGRPLDLMGNHMVVKVGGDETGGAFSLAEYTVTPDFEGPPLHADTRRAVLAFVLEGTLGFEIDGKNWTADAGSVVLIPKGAASRWWNASTKPARWLVLHVPAGIEQFFAELASMLRDVPADAGPAELGARVGPLWAQHGLEPR